MEKNPTTKISLPPRAVVGITLRQAAKSPALRVPRGVDVSPLIVVKQPVRQSEPVRQPEQAGSLSHELTERLAKLEAEIATLKQAARPVAPATGTAALIEQLARERVERELAALVTGQAQTPSPARKRWWQWW